MNKVIKILVLSIFLLTGMAAAQETDNNKAKNEIDFFVDYANFPYLEESNTVTEVYFGWWTNKLTFIEDDKIGQNASTVEILVEVFPDSVETVVNTQRWFRKIPEGLESAICKGYLILTPGRYKMRATIKDMNSQKIGWVDSRLVVQEFFDSDDLNISDIEFGLKIERAKEKNEWFKNGYTIIPNPNRAYDFKNPENRRVKIYAEIINLDYNSEAPSTFSTQYFIKDQLGNTIKSYGPYKETKPGSTCVLAKMFSIATLKHGTYTFEIKVTDDFTGMIVERSREFMMVRPVKVEDNMVSFTEKDAAEFLNIITYIATEQEKVIYDGLDLNGKLAFAKQFWKKRDETPETQRNEYRDEHMRRWNAVRMFDRPKVKGWETDRGRAYVLQGSPDEIDDRQDEAGYLPYQVWYYYDKRIEFVFADTRRTGVYKMLSEKNPDNTGVYDKEWKERIKTNRTEF